MSYTEAVTIKYITNCQKKILKVHLQGVESPLWSGCVTKETAETSSNPFLDKTRLKYFNRFEEMRDSGDIKTWHCIRVCETRIQARNAARAIRRGVVAIPHGRWDIASLETKVWARFAGEADEVVILDVLPGRRRIFES